MQIKIFLIILKSIYNLDTKSKLNTILISICTLAILYYCIAKTLIIKLNKNFNFLLISNNCKLILHC